MKPFAIEPAERAFALARDGVVLASSPSAAADGSDGTVPGADAWPLVRQLPTVTSTRHLGSVLREAHPAARALALVSAEFARRLAAHPPLAQERVWIAAPAGAERFGLGALLAIARQLGLHHSAATLIERDGGPTCRRRSLLSAKGGLWPLYQGWLELINTTMVRQARFDALHDAGTEQQLFDALPGVARDAMAAGVAQVSLTARGEHVEVALTRDQLAYAAQPVWRELVRLTHELRPAGSAVTLVVPQALAVLPGLNEALAVFAGCERVGVPEGFAAAATSLLDLPARAAGEPVRLLRRLPCAAQPVLAALAVRASAAAARPPTAAASHVLFAGRTFALGAQPLVVGRAPGAAHAITLNEGLAGVSRRHCTFLREGAELLLLDHSRFGTFVNGERVAERARVCAGDQVRIGDPGIELALIAVADAAGESRAR